MFHFGRYVPSTNLFKWLQNVTIKCDQWKRFYCCILPWCSAECRCKRCFIYLCHYCDADIFQQGSVPVQMCASNNWVTAAWNSQVNWTIISNQMRPQRLRGACRCVVKKCGERKAKNKLDCSSEISQNANEQCIQHNSAQLHTPLCDVSLF